MQNYFGKKHLVQRERKIKRKREREMERVGGRERDVTIVLL